jgi:hypothetical protein
MPSAKDRERCRVVAAAIAALCRIDPFPSASGRDRLITNRLEGYGMKRREFIAVAPGEVQERGMKI